MKTLLNLTFLFGISLGAIPVLAQDTLYYAWHTTTVDKAAYFRTKTKRADGWEVADKYLNTGGIIDDSYKRQPIIFKLTSE